MNFVMPIRELPSRVEVIIRLGNLKTAATDPATFFAAIEEQIAQSAAASASLMRSLQACEPCGPHSRKPEANKKPADIGRFVPMTPCPSSSSSWTSLPFASGRRAPLRVMGSLTVQLPE